MNATATLEPPVIEDTSFGEDLVTVVENDTEDSCVCFCGCRTSDARSGNSLVLGAGLAVGK